MTAAAWTQEQFEQQLRERGRAYHIHHPFNVMLNSGRATPEQIRGWVANRFYYQINIPLKDAAILANCDERAVRRNWVQRILDHDGNGDDPGGIESWLRLAEAVGLARAQVESLQQLLSGVRFAVDAYVNFARPGRKRCAPRLRSCSPPKFTASAWPRGRSTTRGSIGRGSRTFKAASVLRAATSNSDWP